MAFQGSLAELHLPDIIQLISVSGKTGVFHLTNGPLQGQIYLHDGKIVHAALEDVAGEEAVYALAIWSQGDFRFEPGSDTSERTITKSNTNLLMEAARRLDEWRVLSKKVPSVDWVPEFVVLDNREGQINLNTSEWMILSKIDGHRSVKGIAADCSLSVFDVAKILYGLVAAGLISVKEPATPPPAPAPRPAAPAAPPARASAGPTSAEPELMSKLNRVREICNTALGAVGESVVNKHYQKARADLERGAGVEAVEEAINQIARAASILKGPTTTETLLEQLRALK
ncbi:MAG TPA: DUF4388 domain-containing protein [Vicinamibacteria bacterium]|nr:DUF4388 domain-containing protein [Vicinamibacteria bacterium]